MCEAEVKRRPSPTSKPGRQVPSAKRMRWPLAQHQQANQHGGDTGTQGNLHQWRHIRRLEHQLLQAPDQAQHDHDAHRLRVEHLAAIHAGILSSRIGH